VLLGSSLSPGARRLLPLLMFLDVEVLQGLVASWRGRWTLEPSTTGTCWSVSPGSSSSPGGEAHRLPLLMFLDVEVL